VAAMVIEEIKAIYYPEHQNTKLPELLPVYINWLSHIQQEIRTQQTPNLKTNNLLEANIQPRLYMT
jgi:hypothetical protein